MCSVVGPRTARGLGAADDSAQAGHSTDGGSTFHGDEVDNAHYCTARLAELLDSGKLSDVTLVVGSRRYRCHRLLLANASSVFE